MTDSLFDRPLSQLNRWGPGEPLDHRKLNEPVEALNRIFAGVAPPLSARPYAPARPLAKGFKIVAAYGDYLECHTWDGLTEGGEIVKVALPWGLSQTPFDGQDFGPWHYEYTGVGERETSLVADAEQQITEVINPPFVAGEVIRATRDSGYTPRATVETETGETSVVSLDWLYVPDNGRAWARKAVSCDG